LSGRETKGSFPLKQALLPFVVGEPGQKFDRPDDRSKRPQKLFDTFEDLDRFDAESSALEK
jgi:hypothetical protein